MDQGIAMDAMICYYFNVKLEDGDGHWKTTEAIRSRGIHGDLAGHFSPSQVCGQVLLVLWCMSYILEIIGK